MSIQQQIESKLQESLSPLHIQVENESHQHSGPGIETHFKVTVVSEAFLDKNLVARHRSIYALLQEELNNGVHALALHTFTPAEWGERGFAPDSPLCMGGSKSS